MMRGTSSPTMSTEMQRCIDECSHCHAHCLSTVPYCLQQGGKHAEPSHVRLLLDCAQICQTSADFMIRGSDLHDRVCSLCAEVCDRGAQDCDQFGDDPTMRSCGDACRSCADSCRRMAAAPA